MKTILFLLTICISATGFSQASVTATASVTILKTLSVTKEPDMNFAEVTVDETSGTVMCSSNSSRTTSGGASLSSQGTRTFPAASFKITGAEGAYSISVPEEIFLSNGSRTLRMNNFTHNSKGILEDGAETVLIGATLHFNGMQEPGTYKNSSDLRVTVQYR